ncbi:UxaA family hydrolase [Paraburkholderia fynbosensis]|uniref:Galactarate dehydratase (L-threo-forming) n=1 Tax=Paraburkholderia fynbosensis TaxID=1200993 RepID=A0A6J5H1X4_9BURK|nr:altronate dehydratase family protein [Paraburkholderia fynbosensis]CAB3809751.1 Galactarate dehydratase (L-threo-forming) [Paraburkholderia fynbosensis]
MFEGPRCLLLHEEDNVAVALTGGSAGEKVAVGERLFTLADDVPSGHKIAVKDILAGAAVIKFGQLIGVATSNILQGQHVHVQNLTVGDEPHVLAVVASTAVVSPTEDRQALARTFMGYRRPNGKVGTRNYLAILSSVNCSATACRQIEKQIQPEISGFANVDGVVALVHQSGCGMNADGDGWKIFCRTLSGYANHPNFAGVLVVGLGCEVAQISSLLREIEPRGEGLLQHITIQDAGGTRQAVEAGLVALREMLHLANGNEREIVPAEHLVVGLQCGGSDGYSGISANPVLGKAVDLIVQAGGTAILSETPEIHGAEALLTGRAASRDVATKLLDRMEWWKEYTARNNSDMDNNPSPGNKAGGITTILEKSLGAVAKAGSTPLMGVFLYAELISQKGLVFMDSPGYDPVSATGQVASGANLICFTTGRGSTYGCKPSPCIKIATNSPLFRRMSEDMDFNAGVVLDGDMNIDEASEDLFELILDVASGRKSASEENDLGDNEFVPWHIGAVL